MNPMMMKKIQKMQRDMVKAQQEIEQSVFTGSAAGGMVTVEATGTKQINKITINNFVITINLIKNLFTIIDSFPILIKGE